MNSQDYSDTKVYGPDTAAENTSGRPRIFPSRPLRARGSLTREFEHFRAMGLKARDLCDVRMLATATDEIDMTELDLYELEPI